MKRQRDSEPTSSPVKRQRRDTFPQTPVTPYTPYPLHPSDSPTNPFRGKNRVDRLPPVTSFRKHIALRFQLYRRGVGFRKGGVHRIVQVPLNYTFTHLRALIAWLFDAPAKSANGKAREEDYLFEVKTNIMMESTRTKPGMIKRGSTSVKVSNARDPWRKRYGQDADDQDELSGEESEEGDEKIFENDVDDCTWQDEEDYTLGHVWFTGVQADRGIIYHHSTTTQVHITANVTKLPRRRGKSNVPYVFFARGRVYLSPRPLPRPVFTQSILHTLLSSPAGPSTAYAHAGMQRNRRTNRRGTTISQRSSLADAGLDVDGDSDQEPQDSAPTKFRSHGKANQNISSRSMTSRTGEMTRETKSPEVIIIEDSDEEVVVFVDDSDDEKQHRREESPEDDEDDLAEAYDHLINPDHWNESHYAFGRYLLSFLDPRGRSYAHFDDDYFEDKRPYDPFENDDEEETVEEEGDGVQTSTPDLTSSLSTNSTSTLPPSSPPAKSLSSSPTYYHSPLSGETDPDFALPFSLINNPLSLSPHSSLELHTSIIASHYPNKKYTFTPAPPKAGKRRLQLERMERRLEKVKNGQYLCECDEPEEDNDKDDEVDELFDDDDDHGKWVKPLTEDEVWDPFGDEVEV